MPGIASDGIDQLSDDERAELERELEASIAEAEAGETEDFAAVLAELRAGEVSRLQACAPRGPKL